MTWPFQTLRILYPTLTVISLINISLLSAWVSSTDSLSKTTIKFPPEIYMGFVFSIISFLFTTTLCFPTISRRFGYKNYVYLTDIIFSILWFTNSIIIVARVNDGSLIDSNYLKQSIKDIEGVNEPEINKSLSLGKAITVLSWIQFITWSFTTILLTHIRSRKWTKKDQNKRITIVSGQYDNDAKMLNTPAIIQEIDDLVKNPQTVQTTKEPSSKVPVLELNLSLTSNMTTLYSLDPVSTPNDDLYSRALYDYK